MSKNPLYPIFLRLDQLRVLIVGGGNVAQEKLHFILQSSPNANITLVAAQISNPVWDILNSTETHIDVHIRNFIETDLDDVQIVVAATNNRATNSIIRDLAKTRNILVNVADTPDLCDFYLGSIVTKGSLKIAVSTNGQSPTLARRVRQFLESAVPDEIDDLIENLAAYRMTLVGDFEHKVKALNALTASLVTDTTATIKQDNP